MTKTKEAYWKAQCDRVCYELSVYTFALIAASEALANYEPERWSGVDSGMIFSKLTGDVRQKYAEYENKYEQKEVRRGDTYGNEA